MVCKRLDCSILEDYLYVKNSYFQQNTLLVQLYKEAYDY